MRAPYLDDGDVVLYAGDCVEVMAELPEASVDAVVTDPPYGLGFMGKEWDTIGDTGRGARARTERASEVTPKGQGHSTSAGPYLAVGVDSLRSAGRPFQAWCESWAAEALRVLKPGGHLVAFGGTRTYHRLACALEDAGFEIRDCLVWLYGSGFPKSLDVSKAIDRAAGAEREVVRAYIGPDGKARDTVNNWRDVDEQERRVTMLTAPATTEAAAWQGWGTALKPGHEPIVLARKPLAERTVAAQVLATGTGAVNVDGCRVGMSDEDAAFIERTARPNSRGEAHVGSVMNRPDTPTVNVHPAGRWPANVMLDEAAAALLDGEVGERTSGSRAQGVRKGLGFHGANGDGGPAIEGDTGGPSRFFYTAKAGADEREGSKHPTVKPLALMRWLVRLVTPPGGVVIEPFAGSGTTLRAAREEGFRAIGIEREAEYLADAAHRLRQLSLFAEVG